MANKKQAKAKKPHTPSLSPAKKLKAQRGENMIPWFLLVAGITAVCLWPMLNNEFTNWDDEFYVINNQLLRGPDWAGIFSEPVVGNYHPLTVLTLAFNYAISGLDPFSYLLVNYLLHIINVLLVFRFIWLMSDKNKFIAAFVAIVFGIHPMHIESVAWVSERKDVLYTLFFLLSLLQYWKFLMSNRKSNFWYCFIFFVLSLLSKPAAIILPLVLLLLDYWKGRPLSSKVITEKIPFLVLAFLFGIITVMIQSPTAMAGLNVFSFTDRILFACYVLMMYFIRFFYPHPLSAFHPFPVSGDLGWPILISPLFVVAMVAALWFFRKNKIVVFGILFYVINLLLVLQIVSIGLTLLSERYTYVPYIGLAFMIAMLLNQLKLVPSNVSLGVATVFIAILGIISFQRADVWQNSGSLWTDALKTFPNAPYARTNRANYLSKLAIRPDQKPFADSLYRIAFEDCAIALSVKPNHAPAYEYRGLMYLDRQQIPEAFADANELIKLKPDNRIAYDIRATCYYKMNEPAKALADYDMCVKIKPDDHRSYNNKATILMNSFQKYNEAIVEFNKAISIQPVGYYYLNRSICYFRMKDITRAREDASQAMALGAVVTDAYKASLQLQ